VGDITLGTAVSQSTRAAQERGTINPPEIEKAAREGGLLCLNCWGIFLLYPLLSGYQVQPKNRPNIFEVVVVEVAWNVGSLLRFWGAPLDRFSTFGGFRGSREAKRGYAQSRV
jgi:hypothetical protein